MVMVLNSPSGDTSGEAPSFALTCRHQGEGVRDCPSPLLVHSFGMQHVITRCTS
jgi:hypothetical protein